MGAIRAISKYSFLVLSILFAIGYVLAIIRIPSDDNGDSNELYQYIFYGFYLIIYTLNIYGAIREVWKICALFACVQFIGIILGIITVLVGSTPNNVNGLFLLLGFELIYFGLAVYLAIVFRKKPRSSQFSPQTSTIQSRV